MAPLMLKTDLFVGVQQILVADITYYLLITAYPLHRRPQLPVTGGAFHAGLFRYPYFHSSSSNFSRKFPFIISATILPRAVYPAIKSIYYIIPAGYNEKHSAEVLNLRR